MNGIVTGLKSAAVAFLVAIALVAGGCDEGDSRQPLRIGTNVWPGYEPLYLARELGYFNEDTVRLVEYSSASQVGRAFRNKLIDAAALTLDEVLLLAQYGFEPEVVLVMDISNGGDVILARPGMDSMQALRGHAIGVESTALGAYVLTRALQQSDIPVSDVTVVPLEVDEHEQAFNAGTVDAVVTFEPVRSRLLQAGAVQVFDSSQIPGEVVDVLVVRREFLLKHPDSLQPLIDSWYRALDYMKREPDAAMQLVAKRLRLSPADANLAYQGLRLPGRAENLRLLAGKDGEPQLFEITRQLTAVMLDRQLLRHEIDGAALYRYVRENAVLHKD